MKKIYEAPAIIVQEFELECTESLCTSGVSQVPNMVYSNGSGPTAGISWVDIFTE